MSEYDDMLLRPEDAPSGIYGSDGRPKVFQDPAMDRFAAVLLNVVSELWVQTERVSNIEAAIAEKGLVTADDLKAIAASSATDAVRQKEAQEYIQSVLAPLRENAA